MLEVYGVESTKTEDKGLDIQKLKIGTWKHRNLRYGAGNTDTEDR